MRFGFFAPTVQGYGVAGRGWGVGVAPRSVQWGRAALPPDQSKALSSRPVHWERLAASRPIQGAGQGLLIDKSKALGKGHQ